MFCAGNQNPQNPPDNLNGSIPDEEVTSGGSLPKKVISVGGDEVQ